MNKLSSIMVCVVLSACGGGSGEPAADGGTNDVEPTLIPGGGASSGAIGGEINVFVIDDETGAVIPGAWVRIGDAAAATPLVNQTNTSGLAEFVDDSLNGAQTVTVVADGYAAATWVGVNGANVTIPLARNPRPAVPAATVSGTIDGWASLPAPGLYDYNLAIVLYSWSARYGARENSIEQPMNGDTPANFCIRTSVDGDTCNWTMKTRAGKQVHYAVIVRGATNGTVSDTSDDTYTLLGYAVKTGLDLSAGQTVSNETLTMVSATETNVAVQFSGAPSGANQRLAFPFIDAGDAGQLAFPLPALEPGSTSSSVPALTGPFAQMSYQLVGLAVADPEQPRPYSATFSRGVSFAGTESLAPFLELPSGLSSTGNTYSFSPAAGASVHAATIADANDQPAWTILFADGSSTVTLPELSPDPLAGGNLTFRVAAVELPGFDPSSFRIEAMTTEVVRVSEASR